ncbi:MAG: branched-chain amino acid transport system permease protein [Puniceicoccaceae bacterium 5H]|nr:MAG: branched-chain amino acid transport system permease protein [Puniceicoccaceae bacterium 5H]
MSTLTPASKDKNLWAIAVFVLIGAILLPLLNMGGVVAEFQLNTWGKYLCYATLAVSVNLLWGYTGLLSLGQALFFALGGYAFGMYLMLMIGEDPNYHTRLPDFMDFMGYQELPWHWQPFEHAWFAVAAVVLVPGIFALIFGFLAFRARIKGVYFSIITQTLTYAAALLFFRNEFTFGGNNGFTDFKEMFGLNLHAVSTQRGLFIASVLYLAACLLFNWWLTRTKFGKVQQAIRDSENRVRFSGYDTLQYKMLIFTAAAIIGGVGGALYVPQVGIINPNEMMPVKSLEAVVWVAVGGRGRLWGPVIGAILVNAIKSWATVQFPNYWLIMLGALFLFVVLFLPGGVASIPEQFRHWRKKMDARRQAPAEPMKAAEPVAEVETAKSST